MKPCPYCAELIQDQAAKCRYCGEWLDPSKRPAWSEDAAPAAAPAPAPAPAPAAPAPREEAPPAPDVPTSATLPVGSGLPEMSELTARSEPEPARSWSAPAWLANAQATRTEPEPEPEPEPRADAGADRSTLEEVAARMERIRQSTTAVRDPEPEPGRRGGRAELEPEPGVTLPAGSVRELKEGRRDGRRDRRRPEPEPPPRDDYDDEPPRRLRERPRRPEPLDYSDRPTIPDIPREELMGDAPPKERGRRRKAESRAPEPPDDYYDDEDEPEPEPPPRRRGRRRDAEPAPPPPADFDDEDDDWDDEPPPRRAGAGGFDDDFLGDDDDYDDEGDDFDDFGDMGSAPQPLPWKPILIGAAVIVALGVFFLRDSLFPGDPETDEAAQADSEGAAEGGDGEPEAKEAPEPEAKAKPEGEGQPVEPEAKADGGQPAAADGGTAATPPKPAAADPATVAKLEEARKAYEAANGNKRKLGPVGEQLQQILAAAPDHPEALTLLAQVYLEQEKLEESLTTSNKCTQVSPESAGCWLTIGVIQETKGAKDIAKPAYQKYLDLAPEGRYAKDAQRALKRLK